jgi:hypothetical protein
MQSMKATGIAVGLAIGCASVSCSEGARALIPVTVMARSPDDVSGVAMVRISAMKDTTEVAAYDFTWSSLAPSPTYGLYVSADVTGEVTITAKGMSGSGLEIATSFDVGRTQVVPGRISTAVTLMLQRLLNAGFDAGMNADSPDGRAGMRFDERSDERDALVGPDTATVADASAWVDGGLPARDWSRYQDVRNDNKPSSQMTSAAIDPMSSTADAVIVWAERFGLKAIRRVGGVWISTFETLPAGIALFPRVRFDGQGCALALWMESGDSDPAVPDRLLSARSCNQAPWSAPTVVGGARFHGEPDLAVARNGAARAVWTETSGDEPIRNSVMTAYFDGTGWSSPISPVMAPRDHNGTRAPRVVISDSDRGFIAFTQSDVPGRLQIVPFTAEKLEPAYRVDDSSTLQAAADIGAIAMNRAGKAMVVWIHDAVSSHQVMARLHGGGSGWSPAVSLGSATQLYNPGVVVTSDGSVVVGWTQTKEANMLDGLGRQDFVLCRYSRDGLEWDEMAWVHGFLFERDGRNSAPLFGADDTGFVHMAWTRKYAGADGALNAVGLWEGKATTSPRVVMNPADAYPSGADLAVGPGGHAILTWILRDFSTAVASKLWVSEFR